MSINCLRLLPNISFPTNSQSIKLQSISVSLFFSRRRPSVVAISSMSYDKELDAAKRAVTLASRLCQARISVPSSPFLSHMPCSALESENFELCDGGSRLISNTHNLACKLNVISDHDFLV